MDIYLYKWKNNLDITIIIRKKNNEKLILERLEILLSDMEDTHDILHENTEKGGGPII